MHIFGAPSDMIKINEIAHKYGLKVVEDAAQAFGARIGSKKKWEALVISVVLVFIQVKILDVLVMVEWLLPMISR